MQVTNSLGANNYSMKDVVIVMHEALQGAGGKYVQSAVGDMLMQTGMVKGAVLCSEILMTLFTGENKSEDDTENKSDDDSKKIYSIEGSSFSGKAPSNAVIGNWWNHNILQSEVIISPISGSLKFQEVIFLSKETLKIDNNIYNTSLFKIVLRKRIGDEKKEEFNVWLDDKSKIILKVSYSKFGDWEYIVKKIEKLD
mgnify:CR=1 FL=1